MSGNCGYGPWVKTRTHRLERRWADRECQSAETHEEPDTCQNCDCDCFLCVSQEIETLEAVREKFERDGFDPEVVELLEAM